MIKCLLVILSLTLCSAEKRTPATSKHFKVQQLSEGVWAAIQNDIEGYAICNAGIVDLGDKTLVFDAFINPNAAADLKRMAIALTGNPVTILVNSHYHDDHVRGTQVFADAVIISTAFTQQRIAVSEPKERANAIKTTAASITKSVKAYEAASPSDKKEAALWVNYYKAIQDGLDNLQLVLPGIGFTDSLVIKGSKRTVVLKEFKNAHTASDAILLLRNEGIAFMGDMLFVQNHPFIAEGDPVQLSGYLSALYADASLHTFVPGHGPVAGKEGLQQEIDYISHVHQRIAAANTNKVPDSVFLSEAIPAAYNNWSLKRFYRINLSVLRKKGMN
jgi:cyclase